MRGLGNRSSGGGGRGMGRGGGAGAGRVGAAYVHNAEPKFHINQASPVFRLSVLNVGQIWFVKV